MKLITGRWLIVLNLCQICFETTSFRYLSCEETINFLQQARNIGVIFGSHFVSRNMLLIIANLYLSSSIYPVVERSTTAWKIMNYYFLHLSLQCWITAMLYFMAYFTAHPECYYLTHHNYKKASPHYPHSFKLISASSKSLHNFKI